jgi:hypothetical protein
MKRILVFLILFSVSCFPIAHGFAHADIHAHVDELQSITSGNHSHIGHHHDEVEAHQNHQENIHKHIDILCLRSPRQKKIDHEVYAQHSYSVEKAFLYVFYFSDLRVPIEYKQTTYHPNQPFLSSNQPLLI